MPLRCVYTDLDGTLLGRAGSLFADRDGNFSMTQARGLEACARAGVEVVIMSGRRRAQVHEDARLMGQQSYVFEAGCAFCLDGEVTSLTGDEHPGEGATLFERIEQRGVPELLFGHFEGRLEYHSPWHVGREHSHLFRGLVDVDQANSVLNEAGHGDLRLLDNGAIGTPMPGMDVTHAYHLVPEQVSKAAGVEAHRRARGFELEQTIGVGDSVEDLEVARSVGRMFIVANGPARDPGLGESLARFDNATVTEGTNGEGFYEAVVGTLMAG